MTQATPLKILFIGDISARPGRHAVRDVLPQLRKKLGIDLVIANAENAAGGRGVTREILNELQSYGIDFFTAGEHVWDRSEFRMDLEDKRLPIVRPYNYEAKEEVPGKGWDIIDLGSKGQVIVACFLGQEFMRQKVRSPFWMTKELETEIANRVGKDYKDIPVIIDIHAEATAEKASFAWAAKGFATAVLGTHTHVGTIDTKLLSRENNKGKCAYVSDVGMSGAKYASLWVAFNSVIPNFKYPFKQAFKVEHQGERIFNSVVVEINKNSAEKIYRIDREIK